MLETFGQILNSVCRLVRLLLRMGNVISVTPPDLLEGICILFVSTYTILLNSRRDLARCPLKIRRTFLFPFAPFVEGSVPG